MNLSSPLATLLIASKGQAPEITGPHILIRNKLMSILQDRNEEIILSKPILVSLEEICPDSGTFIMQSITADAVFSECLPRGKSFPSYREGRRPDLSNRTWATRNQKQGGFIDEGGSGDANIYRCEEENLVIQKNELIINKGLFSFEKPKYLKLNIFRFLFSTL